MRPAAQKTARRKKNLRHCIAGAGAGVTVRRPVPFAPLGYTPARAADGDGAWLAFEKGRSLGLKPERDERVVSSVLCAFSRTKEARA